MLTRHLPVTLLLTLLTSTTLSLVVPHLGHNIVLTRTWSSTTLSSLTDLKQLHTIKTQSNSLICQANTQGMSCFGGIPVTLQTCRDVCICENGQISCPTYKFCDDATMDAFCSGMCACTISNSNSDLLPSNIRLGLNDDSHKDNYRDKILLSSHHYLYAESRQLYDDDDDDDDDRHHWEDDGRDLDDARTATFKLRGRHVVASSTPAAAEADDL